MKILEIIQENPTISVKQISKIIDEIKYDVAKYIYKKSNTHSHENVKDNKYKI